MKQRWFLIAFSFWLSITGCANRTEESIDKELAKLKEASKQGNLESFRDFFSTYPNSRHLGLLRTMISELVDRSKDEALKANGSELLAKVETSINDMENELIHRFAQGSEKPEFVIPSIRPVKTFSYGLWVDGKGKATLCPLNHLVPDKPQDRECIVGGFYENDGLLYIPNLAFGRATLNTLNQIRAGKPKLVTPAGFNPDTQELYEIVYLREGATVGASYEEFLELICAGVVFSSKFSMAAKSLPREQGSVWRFIGSEFDVDNFKFKGSLHDPLTFGLIDKVGLVYLHGSGEVKDESGNVLFQRAPGVR